MNESYESEVDDILGNVAWNDSEYATSGSEWLPSDEEREKRNQKRKERRASECLGPSIETDSDSDEPIPKRRKTRTRTKRSTNSDDGTDEEPLKVLQEKLRNADSSDGDPLSTVQQKLYKENESATTVTEPAVAKPSATDWVDGDLPESDILFTGSDGLLHDFDVYQGGKQEKTKDKEKPVVGASSQVVLDMCEKLESDKNFIVFADNYFTSLQLCTELKKRGIYYAGTVRINRLKGCDMDSEKNLKKRGRGSMVSKMDKNSDCVAVRWFDNRKVDLLSSFVGAKPTNLRKAKEMVEIPCPAIVKSYNQSMGGVDLLDSLTALFKAKIKSRRWYMYIFFHSINMIVVTAWLLYRRRSRMYKEKNMPLCDFQSQIATGLIKTDRKRGRKSSLDVLSPPLGPQRPAHIPRPISDVRYDGIDHLPVFADRQRCKETGCVARSNFKCPKCKMHLCLNRDRKCYQSYHTKK